MFAFTFIWKYGYPLTGKDELITIYDDDTCFEASLTVSLFLILATIVWRLSYNCFSSPKGSVRAISAGRGDFLLIAIIYAAGMFHLSMAGQWFYAQSGWLSVGRAAVLGLASISVFVLAYRWGTGEIDFIKRILFAVALSLMVVASSMSLLLVDAIVTLAFACAAYVIGGGKVPWKIAGALLAVIWVLHLGKGEMRDEYWNFHNYKPVQLWEAPEFYEKWVNTGLKVMSRPRDETDPWTLSERMSLVHLLMMVQLQTPDRRPYLNGETYAIIPSVLMPRLINPKKPVAHEGSHILSIYYGLQTREGTETSTIAWGPLIESYANFGWLGIVGLAAVVGVLYGWVAKWSSDVPILSLRMLIAIVFTAMALQVEWTAGVYVSALFQSLVIVCALGLVLMPKQRLKPIMPRGRVLR
jgi:hypothetical protein